MKAASQKLATNSSQLVTPNGEKPRCDRTVGEAPTGINGRERPQSGQRKARIEALGKGRTKRFLRMVEREELAEK